MKKTDTFFTLFILLLAAITCGCNKQNENDVQSYFNSINIDRIVVYHNQDWKELTPDNAQDIIDKISDVLQYPSNFLGTTDGEMIIEKLDAGLTDYPPSEYVLVITFKNAIDFSYCDDGTIDTSSISKRTVYGLCYTVDDHQNILYLSTDENISSGGTFAGIYTEKDFSELNDVIMKVYSNDETGQ